MRCASCLLALMLGACATVLPTQSPAGSPTLVPESNAPSPTSTATPSPSLDGDFVGSFAGDPTGCLLFFTGEETFEFHLPHRYKTQVRLGRVQIVDRDGIVVASEYDRIGVNGGIVGGGSYCMLAPHLQVSEIVAVEPAPAPFTVHRSKRGVRYPLQIRTHCGLEPVQLVNTWWEFDGPTTATTPEGFGDPFDVGAVIFQDDKRATYTSSGGVTINLTPMRLGVSPSIAPCPS
jgi:hypothetical protein